MSIVRQANIYFLSRQPQQLSLQLKDKKPFDPPTEYLLNASGSCSVASALLYLVCAQQYNFNHKISHAIY